MKPALVQGRPRTKLADSLAHGLLAVLLLAAAAARAEPYLAVRSGQKCMACHVNPTGGGKRTEFGSVYGQTALAQRQLDLSFLRSASAAGAASDAAPWTGKITDWFGLGIDLRATQRTRKVPGSDRTSGLDPTRAQVYFEVQPHGDRLTLYVDEHVAPDTLKAREAFAMLWFAERSVYVKVGRMYVPFGLRIEDDTAFMRLFSGVNFNLSHDGVEGGLELGPWSAQLAVTNGGGSATHRGKLINALATYVQPDWRLGLSVSHDASGAADRSMQSVFAGLRTGIVSWLASGVHIVDDDTPSGRVRRWASLVEGNIEVAQGHNLKLSYEFYDPNRKVREDQRVRYSAVWEFVPFQFTQFRLGARKNQGIPQNNAQNASELFLQWHAFF